MQDLDESLRALNSRLILLRGKPQDELPLAFERWGINRMAYEVDIEPYAKTRDAAIDQLACKAGVQVLQKVGHTLCDLDMLVKRAGGRPLTTYSSFTALLEKEIRANPISIQPAPSSLPPPIGVSDADISRIPSIEELGYDVSGSSVVVRGGERAALERMQAHLDRRDWIAAFEKPSTSPTAHNPFGDGSRSTTVLSPYLKFGCLSARLLYVRLAEVYRAYPKHAKPPVSLHGQLLWREFYYTCAYATPNYDRMLGNPICRQVPWDKNDEFFRAWRDARTGYPWIDAAMTQLRREGWIHHLARHAVACFLTRGDLWQSWEKGAAVFDELLLDADWAINNGNWMWLSCSCFFYQYFRCYSPVAFPKKYDKNGDYVRRWLPQLAAFPAKYIYEPWKAPIIDQKKAGCIIGVDYPKPIVVHETVSKENMGRMAKAYAAHKEATGGVPSMAASSGAAASSSSSDKRKSSMDTAKQSKLPRKA
uniref:Photolyase/cryptochrome alpha/beta domain-containing protein n=1 Tax=Coccolithus braarudii TaxID=221442 RepID=A0A7S0KZH7_9EUKA